jgi:hypothetical protein
LQPTTTATTVSPAVYTNMKEEVQQQVYVLEILWNKAIPAEQRIIEIGGVLLFRTKVLENRDEIINEIRCLSNDARKLSICSAFSGMQMAYNYLFDMAIGIAKFLNKLNANFLPKHFIARVINKSHSNDLVPSRPSENHSVVSYGPKKI